MSLGNRYGFYSGRDVYRTSHLSCKGSIGWMAPPSCKAVDKGELGGERAPPKLTLITFFFLKCNHMHDDRNVNIDIFKRELRSPYKLPVIKLHSSASSGPANRNSSRWDFSLMSGV